MLAIVFMITDSFIIELAKSDNCQFISLENDYQKREPAIIPPESVHTYNKENTTNFQCALPKMSAF